MRELVVVHGAWLGVGLVLAAALLGAAAQLSSRRLRHLRRWARRVEGLAKAPSITEGATGWFEGVLRVEGPYCAAFDGPPCAVATAAAGPEHARDLAAISRRSSRLVLEVGAERLIVEGPVEVVLGAAASKGSLTDEVLGRIAEASGEEHERTYRTLATELRRLDDGDRVRMAGTLRREADGGTGYREAAGSLALVGAGGPVLAAGAPRLRWPWVGMGLGALGACLAISLAGAYRVQGMELVSILHRHDALEGLRARDRLLRLDPNDHASRAAALRAMGRGRDALEEAERGSDPASLHERLVLLREAGDRRAFVETWLRLVAALDAECGKGGRCLDHASLAAQTLTPARWAGPTPTRAPLAVLFSEASALGDDPETTLRLGARLWDVRPKGPLLARLRATWLFELAGVLVVGGDPEGARHTLARIEGALDDPRLGRPTRHRIRRDLHHLNALLAIREGRARALTATERHHEGGWCPMRDAALLATDRWGRRWPSAFLSFDRPFATDLRAVRSSGVVTAEMLDRPALGPAAGFEHAVYYAPLTGRDASVELRGWLEAEAGCPASMTIAELARETSRSRALYSVAAVEQSNAALACVQRHRAVLDGPWGTGGDPRPREAERHEQVATLATLLRFFGHGPRRPRRGRARARPRYATIVHPALPARAEVAIRRR